MKVSIYGKSIRRYENICKRYQIRCASTNEQKWKPTVGLEIHAQISTKSKLFSPASTKFNSPINSAVSLFDCAIPGTMPVLNKKCVEAGVLTALALGCDVNAVSMFERKHYFYSDLPAGYQITQQKKPLAVNGKVKFIVFQPGVCEPYHRISKIKQIQLEQDSGRSLHHEQIGRSLIDLNRAGLPLMELVFEPDLSSGEEAAALVKELCFILGLLGTCSCKMEEGAFRVDANVSISKHNEPLGTRTELKNIGSIAAVNHAITYEVNRQIAILEAGGQVINETRAWNPICKETVLMREKEEKHDYRFMPETNLPPLCLYVDENLENKCDLFDVPSLRKQLPQLPDQIREVLEDRGLSLQMYMTMTSDLELFRLFSSILENGKHRKPQFVAKILISDVLAFIDDQNLKLSFCVNNQKYIEEALDLLQDEVINQPTLRKLLNELLCESKKMPKQIVQENNWFVISEGKDLEMLCLKILEENPKLVKKYKGGRTKVFRKFLHEVHKASDGSANMQHASKIMTRLLS